MVTLKGGQGAIFKLECAVQHYDWGIKGGDSLIARMLKANGTEPIKDGQPYAELWMGTHPNGPSSVRLSSDEILFPLRDHLGGCGNSLIMIELHLY